MILGKKMWRDVWENKMAYLACIAVIVIGLATYTSMLMARDNLLAARESFYREYRFADGFARVRAMPLSQVDRLREIPGIGEVQGRLVEDVRVWTANPADNVYLRLISYDTQNPHSLNAVKLFQGSFPGERDEAMVVAYKFLAANGLSPGDSLTVIIEGKKVELKIAGAGQSPEYIYAMKDAQNIFPDPRTFEVAYVPYPVMESLFGQKGLINDVAFTLKQGYAFDDVSPYVRTELERYGLEALYPRKDQPSNAMLSQELEQLNKVSRSVPLLFLTISSIILYIMLKRLVDSQRGLIGIMKAFGYRNEEVLRHYLSYGLIVGVAGGILGGLLGAALSASMTAIYREYFSLPGLMGRFSWEYVLSGVLAAVGFSLFAAFQGAKGVLKLQPVEAMRPPVPVFNRRFWMEKIPGFWTAFTVQGRMAVRNIARNKGRSFFTWIGTVFTFTIMAVLWSLTSAEDFMVMEQFTKVQKYDVKIAFSKPLPADPAARELQRAGGVKRAEPLAEVPVSLEYEYRKKDVVALALEPDSQLFTPLDKAGNPVRIPPDGMVLSAQIADSLGAGVGDVIRVESPWAKELPVFVRVAEVVPQYLGSNVYMNREAMFRLLGQQEAATSVLAAVDPGSVAGLKDAFAEARWVSTIEDKRQMIEKYQQLMASYSYMIWVMDLMAVVTGFAVVYNSSVISLAERKRELASLRVLGLRSREVTEVISVEQWLLAVAGIAGGVPLTYGVNWAISRSLSSDLYSIPALTPLSALFLALAGTVLAVWLAQRWVARKVAKLDIVGVLKERE
ncbi:ABC transporter permease [Kyrpidia sp.]|uniref:ABC transporter permease n=1 Tax=Kyrpidia sp. TaxID=2073077 RepID=UPI00258F8152|nr:ABC transporter permease [Kyrpidia sp.]